MSNSMRDAMVKAGLLSEQQRQRVDHAKEALRLLQAFERGGTTFTPADLERLADTIADEMLAASAKAADAAVFVNKTIRVVKRAMEKAE